MSKHTLGSWIPNPSIVEYSSFADIISALLTGQEVTYGSRMLQEACESHMQLLGTVSVLLKAIRRAIRLEREGCLCEMYTLNEGEQCPLCEYKAAVRKAEPDSPGNKITSLREGRESI